MAFSYDGNFIGFRGQDVWYLKDGRKSNEIFVDFTGIQEEPNIDGSKIVQNSNCLVEDTLVSKSGFMQMNSN